MYSNSSSTVGLVVAKVAELQRNQNILYNLVKPKKDEPELVESNLKLANVLPKKRIYRMSSTQELELFRKELLTRPLLLQCTIESGPGVGCFHHLSKYDCRFVQNSEPYIVLLNQIHPKILSRLSMGLDLAVKYMKQSQPFILTFTLNKIIEDLYTNILRAYDGQPNPREKISCNYAELTIRFLGRTSAMRITDGIKVKDMTFSFEDVDHKDLLVDTQRTAAARQRRSLPIDQGELVSVLKGWKFGDFELSDGLWTAYAEITGAPTRSGSTPPPSYNSLAVDFRRPDNYNQRNDDYGYSHINSSENPHRQTTAVVHPSYSVDVYEQKVKSPSNTDVDRPTKKRIKPITNPDYYQSYSYSENETIEEDNTYHNYGYAKTPKDQSPETPHQIAAQELGGFRAVEPSMVTLEQRRPSPGAGYEYGYISNLNVATSTLPNSPRAPTQDVFESFI
ncbi:uncharacterized protein LOC115227130 [Argonauta hians]